MKVYLVQHGDSVKKEANPERPLSEKGKKDIERLAEFIAKTNVTISQIVHSGILRAQQTAETLGKIISFQGNIEEQSGLEPLDPIYPIVEEIENWQDGTLLAGHLPFVGKLAAKILTGNEHNNIIAFEPGTIVCLEKTEENNWMINWMLRPELSNKV